MEAPASMDTLLPRCPDPELFAGLSEGETLDWFRYLYAKPKPETRPEGFPDGQGGWPLYFAPMSFWNNRSFGSLFMFGLLIDVALRLIPLTQNFWR